MNWSMGLCGVVLSSLPALCASRRSCERNIERVVFEVRTEIAKVCQQRPSSAVSRRSMNGGDEVSRWECFRYSRWERGAKVARWGDGNAGNPDRRDKVCGKDTIAKMATQMRQARY